MYYVRLIKLILFLKDKLCKILKNFWVVEKIRGSLSLDKEPVFYGLYSRYMEVVEEFLLRCLMIIIDMIKNRIV